MEAVAEEMTRGREMARQLEMMMSTDGQDFSVEMCRSIVREIFCVFDRTAAIVAVGPESPPAVGHRGRTASSSVPQRKEMSKKRKLMQKWTSQRQLGSGPGAEGPIDDGYSWRKYGQKAILGAKHPRGYYRCTHRDTQGCAAVKQVQKTDDNHFIFNVTYHGTHTCQQRPSAAKRERNSNSHNDLLLSFQNELKVKTEGLDSKYSPETHEMEFSFPNTPVESPLTSTIENCGFFDNAFVSPVTSETGFGYGAEFGEIVSSSEMAMADMTDVGLLLDTADLDQEWPFDALNFNY